MLYNNVIIENTDMIEGDKERVKKKGKKNTLTFLALQLLVIILLPFLVFVVRRHSSS